MITDADIKKMKKVFATKDDLNRFATKDDLKDLRHQINDDIQGKLTKQKDEIVKDVGDYIADTIVPMFEERDKRFIRIERKLNLSPLVD